jgi:hypothetical protein
MKESKSMKLISVTGTSSASSLMDQRPCARVFLVILLLSWNDTAEDIIVSEDFHTNQSLRLPALLSRIKTIERSDDVLPNAQDRVGEIRGLDPSVQAD